MAARPPEYQATNKAAAEWETFREQGKRMVDEVADYYRDLALGKFPVKSQVAPGYLRPLLPASAPEKPETFESIVADVHSKIMPGITHWQSPSFFGYFPASSSPPGILADMLSDAINCIGFSWVTSPACTELETVVLDWLGKLIGLPDVFLSGGRGGGVIQGTASEATLVALLSARERALSEASVSPTSHPARGASREDLHSKLICYTSEHAHSSIEKAAMIAGLNIPTQLRKLSAPGPSFDLSPSALEAAIQADLAAGNIPFFVCASLGTTSSGAFDPIEGIAEITQKYKIWLHVDAAWAGAAFVCPEYQHHLKGIDGADSFDFNPHKWLRVNFDCSAMYVVDRQWLIKALSITPEYLRSREYESGFVSDYRDWQVPLGRRFRSLKLWFVMRMYGSEALREHIRSHCRQAQLFADLVIGDDRFELFCPRSLSLVCFRLK
jgi:aromatic-L-amino-acid decarboxylase